MILTLLSTTRVLPPPASSLPHPPPPRLNITRRLLVAPSHQRQYHLTSNVDTSQLRSSVSPFRFSTLNLRVHVNTRTTFEKVCSFDSHIRIQTAGVYAILTCLVFTGFTQSIRPCRQMTTTTTTPMTMPTPVRHLLVTTHERTPSLRLYNAYAGTTARHGWANGG